MDNSSFETVSLGDYFGVIWRRKWIVILVTILFRRRWIPVLDASAEAVCVDLVGALQPQSHSPRSSTKGVASDWGITYADRWLNRRRSRRQVLDSLKTADRWSHRRRSSKKTTTIAAIPAGNGLQFTVTDATPLNAQTSRGRLQHPVSRSISQHTPERPICETAQSRDCNVQFKHQQSELTTRQHSDADRGSVAAPMRPC